MFFYRWAYRNIWTTPPKRNWSAFYSTILVFSRSIWPTNPCWACYRTIPRRELLSTSGRGSTSCPSWTVTCWSRALRRCRTEASNWSIICAISSSSNAAPFSPTLNLTWSVTFWRNWLTWPGRTLIPTTPNWVKQRMIHPPSEIPSIWNLSATANFPGSKFWNVSRYLNYFWITMSSFSC